MDLKALLLTHGVIAVTCFSTFVAARQLAPEESASSPFASSSSLSLCSRALATTLWGAALAFYSLMPDARPARKTVASLMYMTIFAPLAPLFGTFETLEHLFITLRLRQILSRCDNPERGPDTMSMSTKLRRVINLNLFILFGINQPRAFLKSTKIVANTHIVLGMSDLTMLPETHIDTDDSLVCERNIANALNLGNKTAENSCLMELNPAGKLALMDSRILPSYNQLRFLDGSTIINVQVIGYVTSIVYRTNHHLPVSPIEAIGFACSMVVIVHSVLNGLGGISKYPLLIYLNPTQQQEMLDQCKSIRWSNADQVICRNEAMVGTVVVGSVVVAFTILIEWHVLRISWLDAMGPVLFLLSLITQLFSVIILLKYLDPKLWGYLLRLGCVIISFGGTVVSIVATIVNWQANKFDSRTPFVIHNLPFLG